MFFIKLLRHFFRGFVDGDGSIKKLAVERRLDWTIEASTQSKEFLIGFHNWIKEYFKKDFGTLYSGINKKYQTPYYKLVFSGNNCSFCVAKLLYDNNSISLDQKQKRFDELVEYNRQRIPNKWGFTKDKPLIL